MAPVVHGLTQQFGDKIDFVYLDRYDKRNETFERQFGNTAIPHFLLLDGNGQVIEQWVGEVGKEVLEAALTAATS